MKKSSFEATQPKDADGKIPNLLFSPKLVDPSLLTVIEAKYFSLKSYSARAINDTLLPTYCQEPVLSSSWGPVAELRSA